MSTIKGFPITPRIIGRIAAGHTVKSAEGKNRPVKDDHFTITTLNQDKADGIWETHPIQEKLGKAKAKLTSIPVRIAYNDPDLNLSNRYTLFDNLTGRVTCSGDGKQARRMVKDQGVQDIDCPTPCMCPHGKYCKCFSRAYFRLEDQDDELGVFVLRTTSYNGLNSLYSTLSQLFGLTGGKMAGMPMRLVLSSKTTKLSFGEKVYFAELATREGQTLLEAIADGREFQQKLTDAGLSLDGLEEALRQGLQNSEFLNGLEDPDEFSWVSDEALASAVDESLTHGSGLKQLDSITEKLRKNPAGESTSAQDGMDAGPISAEAGIVVGTTQQNPEEGARAVQKIIPRKENGFPPAKPPISLQKPVNKPIRAFRMV
jgi:hypothetical protein